MSEIVKIYRPVGGTHSGKDTSRELYSLWEENGLCKIEDSPDDFAGLINQVKYSYMTTRV